MLPICVVLKALTKKIGRFGLFRFLLQPEPEGRSQITGISARLSLGLPSPAGPTRLCPGAVVSRDERGPVSCGRIGQDDEMSIANVVFQTPLATSEIAV